MFGFLRRTILGRWSHLPKQTVITDGTASSAVPTTAPSSDVPDLVDSSEFSGSEAEKAKALLTEFSDVVATSNDDVGQTSLMAHMSRPGETTTASFASFTRGRRSANILIKCLRQTWLSMALVHGPFRSF